MRWNQSRDAAMIPELMNPDPDQTCLECGQEYCVVGTDPAVCPECGSRAQGMVGETTVLDVRTQARLDTPVEDPGAPGSTVIEVVVADESDRLNVFYVSGVRAGDPRITTIRIDDVRLQPHDNGWTAEIVPDCVYDAVDEHFGYRPRVAEERIR